MKRYILLIMAMMTIALAANAMSFTQAQREALFLTDKMAYELNLTDEQYDACYEINLDYLMGVSSVDDLYGTYWTRRNLDMSYILLDWQLSVFKSASYFYRPLYWEAGCWHFGIYARYPRRTFYYFSRPAVYVSYRGGHSWRMNGGRSYYHGQQEHFRRHIDNHYGMRDRFDNRPRPMSHDKGVGTRRTERPHTMTPSHQRNFDRNTRTERRDRIDRSSSTRVTVNREHNGIGNRWANGSSERRSETKASVSSSSRRSAFNGGSVKMGGLRSRSSNGNNSSRHK